MGKPLIPVATYMAGILEDYEDLLTGEFNTTQLAEDAADHFDLMGGPPKYDTPEWLFEMAYHIAEREENRRSGNIVPSLGNMINKLQSDWF